MTLLFWLCTATSLISALPSSHHTLNSRAITTFSNVTIFDPPSNYTIPRTLYARTLLLTHQPHEHHPTTLLATWENYLPNNDSFPYFPIYQSLDNGLTWSERSRIYDQVNDWGLRYQPFLYELPSPIGAFPAGTILCAGNSIPDDLSQTRIDLYASTDAGFTWSFVSHIAAGGVAVPDNGLTPVWEPFLLLHDGQLVVYYSDQREWPAHGQTLVHQVSSDLLTWGAVVLDVAYANNTFRPGMPTVAHLLDGKWVLTYEFYGAPEAPFAVYYRLADSPLGFGAVEGQVVRVGDGSVPVSSPYVVWTPAEFGNSSSASRYGEEGNGTVIVSCGTFGDVFVNTQLAAVGTEWTRVPTPEGMSYSRSLTVLGSKKDVLIVGGGVLNGEDNSVAASVVDITKL